MSHLGARCCFARTRSQNPRDRSCIVALLLWLVPTSAMASSEAVAEPVEREFSVAAATPGFLLMTVSYAPAFVAGTFGLAYAPGMTVYCAFGDETACRDLGTAWIFLLTGVPIIGAPLAVAIVAAAYGFGMDTVFAWEGGAGKYLVGSAVGQLAGGALAYAMGWLFAYEKERPQLTLGMTATGELQAGIAFRW